jgi:hypothetical protein
MSCKGDGIEGCGEMAGQTPIHPIKGTYMGGIGRESKPLKEDDDKSKKPPPAPLEDDECEDGDIATPKRDRSGNDDEPL